MPNHATSRLGRWSREHWLLAGLSLALGSLVLTIVPGLASAMRAPAERDGLVSVALALPAPSARASMAPRPQAQTRRVRIESGQTLGAVFSELGLSATLMHRILELPQSGKALAMLRVGTELAFDLADDGSLRGMRFERDEGARIELQVTAEGVPSERVVERPLERRVMVASGEITSSLYADGAKAGLSNAAVNQMANVFSYDIDFSRDLRDGDRFQVVYEEIWRDGERLRSGGIVAASFINRGKEFTALRFQRDGKDEYFDLSGRPLKKSFMRMPIEFGRLSSRFSSARKHPVLGRTRAHKGVDYAAVTGTPIMAAGNARVSFVGWQNGYGRTVILDHGNGYTTLYAHMSRFGKFKTGQRVSQGEVIGYVGATGLATGPHLHYEFRVKGTHRDPLTVTMPPPAPLKGQEMIAFRAATAPALAQLKRLEGVRLAAR